MKLSRKKKQSKVWLSQESDHISSPPQDATLKATVIKKLSSYSEPPRVSQPLPSEESCRWDQETEEPAGNVVANCPGWEAPW